MFTDIEETVSRDLNRYAYNWEDLHDLTTLEEKEDEQFTFSDDDQDLPWVRCVEREDWEFERGFQREDKRVKSATSGRMVDSFRLVDAEVENQWATVSGDTPVIYSLATLADMSCRLLTEMQAPDRCFYSASKQWSRDKWVPQERLFHATVRLIWKYQESPQHLRFLWNRFWSKQVNRRLYRKHTQQVVGLFNRFGVYARNDKRNSE